MMRWLSTYIGESFMKGNAMERILLCLTGVGLCAGARCLCLEACTDNRDCGADEYCAKEPGDCEGEGTCEQRPDACGTDWSPVCGCDGQTYGNQCGAAAAAGVNVDYEGECVQQPAP